MAQNKSIDGLVLRDAPTESVPAHIAKKPAKSAPKVKPTPKPAPRPQKTIQQPKNPSPSPVKTSTSTSTSTKPTKSSQPSPPQAKKRAAMVADFLSPVQSFDFDDLSDQSSPSNHTKTTTKYPPIFAKPKSGKIRRFITIFLLLIALGIIGIIIWGVLWGNNVIAKITGGQGNLLDLVTLTQETYVPLKTDQNGRTNILAFGTSGYDMSGSVDENGWVHDGAQLTDSMMLISLDQETGDVALLSIPRDFLASPTCTATGKINEIFWCNNMDGTDEIAGATALMTEIGTILGVDFQYYAHLNWGSLVSIVDILGGITVTLDEDINDPEWTGAIYQAGIPYTLTGEEALALARARHGTTSGDFSRGASQQKILIGIKDRISEKDFSLPELINLTSALGDNLRTNFTLDEIKSLAHLSSTLNLDAMRQISLIYPVYYLSSSTINGISYIIPSAGLGNYGAIHEYVAECLTTPKTIEDTGLNTEADTSADTDSYSEL